MNADELKIILDKHEKWLNGEEGGERADLSGKRLVGASFAYANLRDANFDNAILINANFTKDAYSRHRRGVEQLLQPDTYGAG